MLKGGCGAGGGGGGFGLMPRVLPQFQFQSQVQDSQVDLGAHTQILTQL